MMRRHRHLDGTEHVAAPTAGAVTTVRVPRLPRAGLVDARLLVVALAVSSPAIYRLAQGMVSVTDVLTRYLLVAVGCVATGALVRWAWPLLSGEKADPVEPLREAIAAGLAAAPGEDAAGDVFGDLGDELDPGAATALLDLAADDDLLELSQG